MPSHFSALFPRTALAALLLAVYWAVYLPGSSGGFILDDFANLDKLGDFNGVRNLDTLGKYLFGGIAGPTGRPLSLLSFLLNAQNWPADPLPFKLSNILLHLCNGVLLYFLCRNLFVALQYKRSQAETAACVATLLWLLHPFFVSTVLYIVQRMAMLAAFFSIAGLWLYSKGRLLLSSAPRRAYLYITAAVGIGSVLAVLSKENGALLPLLILCVEYCIFDHPRSITKKLHPLWRGFFLWLPSIVLLVYLATLFNPEYLHKPIPNRDFSLAQRLLTETRIVCGYLYHLYIPQMTYPGVFYENFRISTSLTQPFSTLPSFIVILLLPLLAFLLRRRFPFWALSILFFFAGHLLESTVVPLELYFEHRNYLPAIFLFPPIGSLFAATPRLSIKAAVVVYTLIFAIYTYQYSKLWGNPTELALYWAAQNPHSARAQRTAAIMLEQNGNGQAALRVIEQAKINNPSYLDLELHWLVLKCRYDILTPTDFESVMDAASRLIYTTHHYNLLEATVTTGATPGCNGMDAAKSTTLLQALLRNPSVIANPAVHFQLHHLMGAIYASDKKSKQAADEFALALKLTGNIEHGLRQTAILASNGFFREARNHLENTEKYLPITGQSATERLKMDYRHEIDHLKFQLEQDMKQTDFGLQLNSSSASK